MNSIQKFHKQSKKLEFEDKYPSFTLTKADTSRVVHHDVVDIESVGAESAAKGGKGNLSVQKIENMELVSAMLSLNNSAANSVVGSGNATPR